MERLATTDHRSFWLLAVFAGLLSGCVVVTHRPVRSEVSTPPPPPAHETALACDPGYARVPGHWRGNGYQYVWIPQSCVYRPGYRWEAGGYYPCGDGYCFKEGAWVQVSAGP